ncbi:MAG: type II secretion system F family protein, partial [Pseudomonadota bacterium]|nr:type II secretion system F family protein [Pseudomonadota bacterium]
MVRFKYKGRDRRGQALSGEVEAESADALAGQLINSGITPVEIVPAQGGSEWLQTLRGSLAAQPPDLVDLMLFCRQMHTLMRAGIPIIRALSALAESVRNPVMLNTLQEVSDSLESGRDLAGSLARHPAVFSPIFISIIRVGEESGRLDEAFIRLYHYLSFEKTTR